MKEFKQQLRDSMKSADTEEWLDVYFTRPIGLTIALLGKKTGTHPNIITILSIFLGMAAGYMFYFEDLRHNLLGMFLLMSANILDSSDGQLARLTGQKTLVGRILDGFAGDVWFVCIYAAIALRLMNQPILGSGMSWGFWIWGLCAVAGLLFHSPQSSLADYYRQIHLFFLKGKEGAELDSYIQQREEYEEARKANDKIRTAFHYNYANYCKSQESRTPFFQKMRKKMQDYQEKIGALPKDIQEMFITESRPLMKYTNILSFNTRAITLYTTCLLNQPWIYMVFEITILHIIYTYMHRRHEKLCEKVAKLLDERMKEQLEYDNGKTNFSTQKMSASTSLKTSAERQKNIQSNNISTIIFDFGGTLDTNGIHWMKMIWKAYQEFNIPIDEQQFRRAYIYVEQELERTDSISPQTTFEAMLVGKLRRQMEFLRETNLWKDNEWEQKHMEITTYIYSKVKTETKRSRTVLSALKKNYKIAVVSNFYGNLNTVLKEFGLYDFCTTTVDSSICGIRKPDPLIFAQAVKALGISPDEAIVIGDSIKNDILPAQQLGCTTIWLKGSGWDETPEIESAADFIITDLGQLIAADSPILPV